MARQEEEREDLMREAIALVNRCEIKVDFLDDTVVVGFRKDGSPSFFFGQNEVYQFNRHDQFRRGYDGQSLIKSVDGKIVGMHRQRQDDRVNLVSKPFSAAESQAYTRKILDRLSELRSCLLNGNSQILNQVTTDSNIDLSSRISEWIGNLKSIEIAKTPRVGQR